MTREEAVLVDKETGEILEGLRPHAQPRWDPNRPSPGEARIGAKLGEKIPKQFPGREMRSAKK